jgi:hypothetical protein
LILQIPVAEDLFLNRNNSGGGGGGGGSSVVPTPATTGSGSDLGELESQRECVLNMLLKLIVYPEAMEVVVAIVGAVKAEGEEKWRKVSRCFSIFRREKKRLILTFISELSIGSQLLQIFLDSRAKVVVDG